MKFWKLMPGILSLAVISLLSFSAELVAHPGHDLEEGEHTETARGVVFHDVNQNEKFDDGDKPLPDIRVSNGQQIVKTDKNGKYELPVGTDTILFVIKPRNWRTPIDTKKLPRFYYIHKPSGSPKQKFPGVKPTGPLPKSVDFPLYPQEEPTHFKAVLFGDPQPRNQKEIDYIAHDIVEELVGTDASFGVTLGDIMFDDLNLFESSAKTIALIGIPWYNVIGNHDINRDAKSDAESDETFESVFGPSYYSFDYGKVHFLVLDNIEWYFPQPGGGGRYRGGLGKKQMEFIRKDLSLIPKDQMVVLMMHIPIVGMRDRLDLYRLIEKRPFCISISGHTHHHEHRYIKKEDGWEGPEPHHHIINVTVSGSWWSGAPDERGIPHSIMADGAPNGYSILSIDENNKYSLKFKAAGRSLNYQMNILAPETVSISEAEKTIVSVNVFNGGEKSAVEMKVGKEGKWVPMKRTVGPDPIHAALFAVEAAIKDATWRKMSNTKGCTHLWQLALPKNLKPGTHLIQIRSSHPYDSDSTGNRVIRVTKESSE